MGLLKDIAPAIGESVAIGGFIGVAAKAALVCVLALPAFSALLPVWQVPLLPAEKGISDVASSHSSGPPSPQMAAKPAVKPAPQAAGAPRDAEDGGLSFAAPAFFTSGNGATILLVSWLAVSALMLARLVTALHWFNPLAWVATRRLQAERERACDDLVLSAGTCAPDYAQHLLEIARTLGATAFAIAGAVAMARPNELEGRLLAILDPDRNRRAATRRGQLVSVLSVGLLVLPLAALQPRAQASQDLQDPFEIVIGERAPDIGGVSPAEQGVDPRVMEAFLNALRDEDAGIRAQAASSLGMIEDELALDALLDALTDEDAGVRKQVLWAVGQIAG